MHKRSIVLRLLIFIMVCGVFLGIVNYYNRQIELRDEKLCLASDTISNYEVKMVDYQKLKKEYESLQIMNNSLSSKMDSLSEEKDHLLSTYQDLVAEFTELQKQSREFESRILEMDNLIQEYDYVFNYDPVLLEECQVHIQELEEKLFNSGEFDKFEIPKRKKEYENFTVWLEDGSSVKWAEEAMNYLEKLPAALLADLSEQGWMFIVTPRSLEEIYGSQVTNTVGLTVYYQKRIYVQNDYFSIQFCSIHEVGHAIDFMHEFISYDQEWRDIYEEEAKGSGLADYFLGSATEYFAQTFQSYILEPEIVKTRAPKSYDFIQRLLGEYIDN